MSHQHFREIFPQRKRTTFTVINIDKWDSLYIVKILAEMTYNYYSI